MQSINKINSTSIQVNFFARKAQNSGFEFFYFRAKKHEACHGSVSCTEGALHGTQCRFIRRSRAS